MKKLMLFILVLFITGCASQEKKHFKAQQFYLESKKELAVLCNSEFPSETIFIKGKEVIKTDTIFSNIVTTLECEDGKIKECSKEKVIYKTITKTDTIQKSNTALETKLRHEINELTADNILLYKEKEKALKDLKTAEKENKKLKLYIAGLILALFISVVVIIKK